jgi:hypothetical protein
MGFSPPAIPKACLATAKMHFEPGAGSVLYRSRMNKKQGGNFAALSPTDFIAAITQHIPDKGFQLVRYYGWYSNKARGVRAKTGAAQAEDSAQGHEPDRAPTSAQWRRLIAKIWEADPLTCPDCGAEMRILAFIEEDRVIGRILRHLGLLPTPRAVRRSRLLDPKTKFLSLRILSIVLIVAGIVGLKLSAD